MRNNSKLHSSGPLLLAILSALCFSISNSAAETNGDANLIRVHTLGLRNNNGAVLCGLYSSDDGFGTDAGKAIQVAKAEIKGQAAVCEFRGIGPGTYAVSAMHDENLSGKIETNWMGTPKKGFGNSNDARGWFGPPKFKDAAFQFGGGILDIRITMTYLM